MNRPLIRAEDVAQLLENYRRQEPVRGTKREIDFVPLVRLSLPFSRCVWLLTEIEHEEPDIAFGLCDLGLGFPELGSVYLPELAGLRHGPLRVIQDTRFSTTRPVSWWTREAQAISSLADVREPA